MKINKLYSDSNLYSNPPEMPIYWNRSVDKGTMKRIIAWFLVHYGRSATVSMIEDLKQVGFQHATRAGISLGIEDLRIPPSKPRLLQEANREINTMEARYHQGYVSVVERFQKVIDTWNSTSEMLKDDVVENFLATDPLNPVYMMAFSGARGNLSQVRQLVGMRGLMSNPQGEIIDLPIRSNFREGLTVTEYIISCYGARKGLVDTALRTANSGYLTRRLVDVAQDIVIRITSCHVKGSGLKVIPFHENKQLAYPVEERLLGRVLSVGAVNKEGQIIFDPNTPISQAIASELLNSIPDSIFVRSVLLCKAKRGLCRLCYGWNLATGTIVSIGEAVGIIAAQSIGEPGTQLTMRTFHTGGVFSGRAVDEIRAPHAGVVSYPHKIKSQFVRTRHGQPGLLTSEDGELTFSNGDQKTVLFCKTGTIITVSEGDTVHANQLIGEIASYAGNPVTSWRTLKSDLDGEVAFDQLEVLKRRPSARKQISSVKIDPLVCNKGYLWVLHGHVNTFEMPIKLFARTGDQVERQSIISSSNRVSPIDGRFIDTLEENQDDIKQIIITQSFSSLKFEGVDAWLPTQYGGRQAIQTQAGNIPVGGKGMSLSLHSRNNEGVLSFDWPAFADSLIEEDDDSEEGDENIDRIKTKEAILHRTPYPLQYSLLQEQKYTIKGQEGWMISVMGGQSVGPNQSLASYSGSQWELCEGKLYLRPLEYRVNDQSWIQVRTPSLLEIESGTGNYQIIAKAGWIIPIYSGIRVKDHTLITGSILFGKWTLPVTRFVVEQPEDYPAILIRPMNTYPIYPANIWDETIDLHEQVAPKITSDWHPRTIAPALHLPLPTETVAAKQTFAGQTKQESIKVIEKRNYRTKPIADHIDEEPILEMRLEKEISPFQVEWTWPTLQNPWISPKHGAIPGRMIFVGSTRLNTSQLSKGTETDSRQERMIVNSRRSSGIHRFTPLINQMVLSEDEGEIQRLLPKIRHKLKARPKVKLPAKGKTGAKTQPKAKLPAKTKTQPKAKLPAKTKTQPKAKLLTKTKTQPKGREKAQPRVNEKRQEKGNNLFESKLMKRMVVVRPEHMVTFATYGAPICIPLGGMIYQGEEIIEGCSSPISGKVIEIRQDRVTLRLGQPYRVGWQARLMVLRQEIVKAEKILAHLLYFKTKTGDIVQGLPKIEEVLEARRKKGNDVIRYNPQDIVQIVYRKYMDKFSSMEKANAYSILEMQIRLLRRVQLVYRSQGVQISDKHIEIIVLRMTSRVLIERSYGTGILPGELMEKRRADHINRRRKRLRYCPVVLGITKAALTTKGFISSASFQETTRVLTQAALRGKSDWLQGLKENVILGRLIPAGVGIYGHWIPAHETSTQKMLEFWVLPRLITGQAAMRALFHDTTRYWQDLEAILETPKKIYSITPYKLNLDFRLPLAVERWMPENEIQLLAITLTDEEMQAAKARMMRSKMAKLERYRRKRAAKSQKKKRG